MKKKVEKKLTLGKIKIASLSKPDQHMIQGAGPTASSPIICNPTVFNCRSVLWHCTRLVTTELAIYYWSMLQNDNYPMFKNHQYRRESSCNLIII